MSNIIYKEVRGFASSLWRRQAEDFAANGTSFVVRPFNKELHWEFLQDLSERFQLTVRFVALERAAYFDSVSTF